MIPYDVITAWSVTHDWPTREQVEQDLLLSQAICEIAKDDFLGKELTIRGGTAFHKLFLPKPYRYSEDIDYVRTTQGGIAEVTKRLTEIGRRLGYSVKTKIGMYPKVYYRGAAQTGLPIRIKIEINTYERSPALPLAHITHKISTDWYIGKARVQTFQVEELIATKIRALYQRSKGRDLFDIWLALTILNLDADFIIKAFKPYRPHGFTSKLSIRNLEEKLSNNAFREDITSLVAGKIENYNIDAAGRKVSSDLLERL
jgi:predicted nucleotidyltransferase component of viral defense system